ncbi:hypothetical protein ACFSJU_12310 [Paradesertivirga mongoliensis]|uniref:Beta-lactamase-inhibitor-like PepSY-like domain-containing protein n=1 Tax=Paradesertivirga mongoliensis TaxID=2100740 RepID=A0ABW4ZN79_9SPHI|nr:hypothetical protein [Pedobacter mongoliensis]
MKNLIIALIATVLSVNAYGQAETQDTLPVAIRSDMTAKFANASAMEWTLADSIYTGTFTLDGQRHLVEYTASGKLRLHRYDLAKADYPATVLALIKKDYASHKIDDIERVERDGVVTFEAELDGSPDYLVVFDSTGKVLSVKKD